MRPWRLVAAAGLAAAGLANVYVAPDEIRRFGLTDYGMALYVFNQYDADRDGVLSFDEAFALQEDTEPALPLSRRDFRLLVRLFGSPVWGLPFEHFLKSYGEPWSTTLGTDVTSDFEKVFALTSRAIRAS